MRSFALHVLSLMILTANLGSASPVPGSGDGLKASSSVNVDSGNGDGIVTRDTADVVGGLVSDNSEAVGIDSQYNDYWDSISCQQHGKYCFRKRSDEAEASELIADGYGQAGADEMSLAADPHVEPNTEPKVRDTCVRFVLGGMERYRCPKDGKGNRDGEAVQGGDGTNAVVKRHGSGALATPDAHVGRKDLDLSVSRNGLFSRQLVGPTMEGMNKPCAKAIAAQYEHVDLNAMSLADKKALIKEIIVCMYGQSTTSQNVSGRKVAGANIASVEAEQRCSYNLIQNSYLRTHWDWLQEPYKIVWWMVLTYCLQPQSGSKQLQERQDIGADLVKDQKCVEKIVPSWTGDLSTKKDQDAFILAVIGCINE